MSFTSTSMARVDILMLNLRLMAKRANPVHGVDTRYAELLSEIGLRISAPIVNQKKTNQKEANPKRANPKSR